MKDVLLVANEKEEFFVDELAQILREEGKTFEYAIGREEAIQKMDDFKSYFLDSQRKQFTISDSKHSKNRRKVKSIANSSILQYCI